MFILFEAAFEVKLTYLDVNVPSEPNIFINLINFFHAFIEWFNFLS